jgi:hypothetical protein
MKTIRKIIWIGTSVIFVILIFESYHGIKTEFPGFDYRIPANYNLQINNVKFQDVINEFADSFDSTVDDLNSNMQHSSKVAFWTNIVSFILAITGFCLEFRKETNV